MSCLARAFFVLVLALGAGAVRPASADETVPPELVGIEIEDRLGSQIPLDTPFIDHKGRRVLLKDSFKSGRPVILVLAYYRCPVLCSLVMNAAVEGLKTLEFMPGKQYELVSLSIDPAEKPELAMGKRSAYLTALGRDLADPQDSWPFLTGAEADIKKVASAVGFNYRWEPKSSQWAHAAGIFVLTPTGRLSRTLYGAFYPSRDLKLALLEASQGSIGSPVERILLWCYHYDPKARSYLISPIGVMRIGGVLTVLLLGVFILSAWRRDRRASVHT
jgi:protein SCO1/2